MEQTLHQLQRDAISRIEASNSLDGLESIRLDILGKKGQLTHVLKGVAQLDVAQRPVIGKLANDIKSSVSEALEQQKSRLETQQFESRLANNSIDMSMPSVKTTIGQFHPIQQTINDIVTLFGQLGFSVQQGPDIESEEMNFEALNIPKNHPARDMHDTFYVKGGNVLRTHTSPVQIRTMLSQEPPIKALAPGKVYRCDADASHSPVFHQIEGLVVDKNVKFSDLKGTLEFFLKNYFGQERNVRFRPSYFPFTEPSVEVDVECILCSGDGCSLCKQTGWIEVLGAGMVQRHVLRYVDIDPNEYSGFAFGIGIDRMAMLKHGISDIRLLYENDLRFLKQF